MKVPKSNYRMIQKKSEESRENEIRVKANARPFVYAAYAGKLLLENKHDQVYMLATGSATPKAIQAVEYIRQRMSGLMACYEIESTEFVDEYEPVIEGLDRVQIKRLVPTLKAHLFFKKNSNYEGKPGFMAALPDNEIFDTDRFKTDIEEHFSKERPARYNDEEGGTTSRGRRGYNNRGRGGRGYQNNGERRDYEDRPRRDYEDRSRNDNQGYRDERPRYEDGAARRGRGNYEGQQRDGNNRGGYEGQYRESNSRGGYQGQYREGNNRGGYEGQNRRGGYEGQQRENRGGYNRSYRDNNRNGYEGQYGDNNRRGGYNDQYGEDNRRGNFRGDRGPRGPRGGENTFRGQ